MSEFRSKWYFVEAVTLENRFLDFDEGGPELNAELLIGRYSPEDLLTEAIRAMNAIGGQTYSKTFDRVTQKATISAPGNFKLRISSGSNSGQSIFSALGFTGVDVLGANSYQSDSELGIEFKPQFPLNGFVDFGERISAVEASINESAQGILEVFSFGEREFMECIISFITDIAQGISGPIENDSTAKTKAKDFLKFIIQKGPLEFMKDRDNPTAFTKIILEKTDSDSKGVGFILKQMTNLRLWDYYQVGPLTFRKVA